MTCLAVKPFSIGTTTDRESTEQVNCYSLKDLAFEGSNKKINTTKASWTIPASQSSNGTGVIYPTLGVHQENFLIWTSRAFDIYTDINLQALRLEGEDERILNEIDAQQPISPITDSAGDGGTKGTAFNMQASSTASANSLKFGAICNQRDRLLSIDLIEGSLILSFRSQCLKVDICVDIKIPGSPYQEVFLVDTKGRVDYSATIRRLAGWDSPACLRRINSFIRTFKRKVL